MMTVSVSELKARLSEYLRTVRRGGEVQILDRGTPIARLTGMQGAPTDAGALRQRLISAGVVRSGSGDSSKVLDDEPIQLGTSLLAALDDERADRF
jgi:prevent-host-death family protein